MMDGCFVGCFYYTDSCFRADCANKERIMFHTPAHKNTEHPAGQVVSQEWLDFRDDMAANATPLLPQAEAHAAYKAPSTGYKPAHGGYPG